MRNPPGDVSWPRSDRQWQRYRDEPRGETQAADRSTPREWAGPLCLAALLASAAGCGATAQGPTPPASAPSPAPSPLAAEAVADVHGAALRAVIADHWEAQMRLDPVGATALGDHRFDDRLARRDAAAIAAEDAERDALLARLAAIDAARLDDADRTTLALLRDELETDRGLTVCRFHEWRDFGRSTR